jgi:hypothetical protein
MRGRNAPHHGSAGNQNGTEKGIKQWGIGMRADILKYAVNTPDIFAEASK